MKQEIFYLKQLPAFDRDATEPVVDYSAFVEAFKRGGKVVTSLPLNDQYSPSGNFVVLEFDEDGPNEFHPIDIDSRIRL